jgi:hypothetical protein
VQQVWSNAAAAAGIAPCIPADPEKPFYNLFRANSLQAISAGGSVQLSLTAWSIAPAPAWTVKPIWNGGTFRPTSRLDVTAVENGDTVTLTVTAPSTAGSGAWAIIDLLSFRNAGDYHDVTQWPVGVYVP